MTRSNLTFVAGVAVGSVITAGLLSFGVAGLEAVRAPQAATATKAAAGKYSTQVVFENERVRVKDVTFPAGVLDTGMHTHDLAHVGVILTEGQLLFTDRTARRRRPRSPAAASASAGRTPRTWWPIPAPSRCG